jgi:hypothetical protein
LPESGDESTCELVCTDGIDVFSVVDVGVFDEVHEEDWRLESLFDFQCHFAPLIGGLEQTLAALRVEHLLLEAGGVDGDLEDSEDEEEEGEGECSEVKTAD